MFFIILLAIGVWLSVMVNEVDLSTSVHDENSVTQIPPLSEWRAMKIMRPQHLSIEIERKGERSEKSRGYLGAVVNHQKISPEWHVTLGDGTPKRAMDPALTRGLKTVLQTLKVIETRTLLSEDEARPLGLTDAALELTVYTQRSRKLRLRVGAEHLRHSTWVRKISSEGHPSSMAWRVNQRLRKALDHLPHAWQDRRFGPLQGGELIKVSCHRGPHNVLGHRDLERDTKHWTIVKDHSSQEWRLKTDRLSPPLDLAATRAFIYTLKTLKVMSYLPRGETIGALSMEWRATHSCTWESEKGEEGWVDLGRARLSLQNPSYQKGQSPHLDRLWPVVSSPRGVGPLPDHIAHFVTPELSQLLRRSLIPERTDRLIEVSYMPPPSPLRDHTLIDPQRQSSPWRLLKRATGWWFSKFEKGIWRESPVPESAMSMWLSLLTKDSASVSYQMKDQRELVTTRQGQGEDSIGALITLSLSVSAEGCPRSILNDQSCSLSLRSIPSKTPQGQDLRRWQRGEDGVDFILAEQHSRALEKGPVW